MRGSAAGTLKVYTDCNLPPVASVPVKPSDDWTEYSEKLEITAGEAPLYFVYEGGGSLDFSVFEWSSLQEDIREAMKRAK